MIRGLIVIRERVHIFAAVLLNQLAELIRLDVLVGLGDGVLPRFFELLQPRFIAADLLVPLPDVGGIGSFYLGQRGVFCDVICGTDLVGPLECHVLEHVSKTGLAHGILRRAGVYQCEEREDGRLRTLADQDSEAVGQFLDRDALFEGCDILSNGQCG